MSFIFGFAGSNSATSINFQLVRHTASLVTEIPVRLMDMANCPFPMYSEDLEREKGFSNSLVEIRDTIKESMGLVISVNEHNSNPSAYFKNLIDWLSRLDRNFLEDKTILLMSTSAGKRGAIGSLQVSEKLLKRFGAKHIITFSLPNFSTSFTKDEGITDEGSATVHRAKLADFLGAL